MTPYATGLSPWTVEKSQSDFPMVSLGTEQSSYETTP